MAKKVVPVLNLDDAEKAAKRFADASLILQGIDAEKRKELLLVEEKYKDKEKEQQAVIQESQDTIVEYLKANPSEFGGKKSKKVWGVAISYRDNEKWIFPDGKKWDDFIDEISKFGKGYAVTKREVSVQTLKSNLKTDPKLSEGLKELGISLEETVSYSVKLAQ